MKHIEPFKLSALEAISKIIADRYTGSEITRLFRKAGFPDIRHDRSTKWKFVNDVLERLQKDKYGPYNIAKVIEVLCDPQEYFGRTNYHREIVKKINNILSFYGLEVNPENGKIIINPSIKPMLRGNAVVTRDIFRDNVVMKDIPLKELGWRCDVKNGTANKIDIGYLLKEGPKDHIIFGILLKRKIKTQLEHVINWGLKQFKEPESYKILGKAIKPTYEVTYLNRSIIGNIFGTHEGLIRFDQLIHHPTKNERGERKFISYDKLPSEIRDLVRLIDEEVWKNMRRHIVSQYKIPEDVIPPSLLKHVFLAYRVKNILGEASVKKLGKYLMGKDISVWYFPWRVGWGDSITVEEENAIRNSFAGIIVLTQDFFEGKTATEEYRALLAKRRTDSDFKVGLLLVGCAYENVPPFMKDYLWAEVDGPEDQRFEEEIEKIYRGLLGLPLETPE